MLKHEVWVHEGTNKEYVVLNEGKIKIHHLWEDSISYQRLSYKDTDDTETIYTRAKYDFLKIFKPKI